MADELITSHEFVDDGQGACRECGGSLQAKRHAKIDSVSAPESSMSMASLYGEDRLYKAMFLQNMLQAAILGSGVFNAGMTPSVRESLAVSYLMGLFSETSEALKTIRFLPQWDKHQTDFDRLREEVVDAFHHVVNLAILLWGVDSDEFFKAYEEKWTRNFKRATSRGAYPVRGRAAGAE